MKKIKPKKIIITLSVFIVVAIITTALALNWSQNVNQDDLRVQSKGLTNYNITATLDSDSHTLTCTQTTDYKNTTNHNLNQVFFHLYPNAFALQNSEQAPVNAFYFANAYPNGFSAGGINILSCSVNNRTVMVGYSNENTILIVPLSSSLKPNERTSITLTYTVTIPNCLHRFGYGENTINLGNFYPVVCVYKNNAFVTDGYCYNGDPFYSEMANYVVEFVAPKNFVVGSTGTIEITSTDEYTTTYTSKALVVRDFAIILSNKYKTISTTQNGILFNYMYYSDETPETSLQTIVDAVNTFSTMLGKYPYSTYTAAESNFIHGGMEYPNLVFLSDKVTNSKEYTNVIVHETGHQWFYNLVGNDEVNEAWLDESLTEYITLLFYEQNPSYGYTYDELISNALSSYLLFVDVYTDVFGDNFNTSMNRSLYEFTSSPEYTYLIYVKGVLMLDDARNLMGSSAFQLALKNYFIENKFKIATTDSFIACFSKATNKDVRSLIMSWLSGNETLTNN